MIAPTQGISLTTTRPTFEWSAATDSQSGVAVYLLTLTGPDGTQTFTSTTTTFTPAADLAPGAYTWSIQARDASGNLSASTPTASFIIADTDPGGTPLTETVFLPIVVKE